MKGSEFVASYANKGPAAWEGAALEAARQGELTPWSWADLHLTDGVNTVTLKVQTDDLAVGPLEDHVRIPLTPNRAQDILNLYGWLLPTPWLVYQIWKQAPIKLTPTSAGEMGEQNRGADLLQYARHSALVDRQIAGVLASTPNRVPGPELVAGSKKHVVVSNIYQPRKVLIFGWYRPPPAPDVFDDGRSTASPGRQPIQPRSNVHGDFYVDYSHGIRAVGPTALVSTVDAAGDLIHQEMLTADLYQHPTLSKLVSNEGPVKHVRYPSQVAPPQKPAPVALDGELMRPVHVSEPHPAAIDVVPTTPPTSDLGLAVAAQIRHTRRSWDE